MTSPFQTAFGIDASSLGYRPNLRPLRAVSPSGGCAPRVPPVRRSFGLCHPQGAAPPECPPFEGPSGCVTLRGLRPPSAPRSKVLRAVSPSGGCAPRVPRSKVLRAVSLCPGAWRMVALRGCASRVGPVGRSLGCVAVPGGVRDTHLGGLRPPSAPVGELRRRTDMPIATPEVYAQMLDRAKAEGFAYPAINVTSSETVNAAIKGFADAGSDGIIQVSTGGAEFASGTGVKNMVTGAVALAEFAHVVAERYPVNIALHTDHCPKDKLDTYVRPLLAISEQRIRDGGNPLFQSHMWDGSAVELTENLQIAADLLDLCARAKVVLEIEIGVVGGEEDGVVGEMNEKLYSTPEDAMRTVEALGFGEKGRYLLAATFGNVHGVYKPGNVKLRPEILKQIQDEVGDKIGRSRPFDLVFHGGSGSA